MPGRRRPGSTPGAGPWPGSRRWSPTGSGCTITATGCGTSCADAGGACNIRRRRRGSATRRRSRRGGAGSGPGCATEARRRGAWIVFADESGVSTRPPLRTTWARRGHTPTVVTPGRRRWLSLAGFVCYHPGGHTVLVHYTHRRKGFDTEALIDALRGLHRFLTAPAVLVWDNLGAHHSVGMRGFLATQTGWLRTYAL